MKESELKFFLSNPSYLTLLTTLLPYYIESKVLWNNYYDTPDFVLDKAGCTVRLRLKIVGSKATKAVVDLKLHKGMEGHARVAEEQQHVIFASGSLPIKEFVSYNPIHSPKQAGQVWNEISQLTHSHPIWLIGGIQVTRNIYHYKGLVLELDKIDYSDTVTEYELECETEDEASAYQIVEDLFQNNSIQLTLSIQGKRKRFLQLRESNPEIGRTYNILRDP